MSRVGGPHEGQGQAVAAGGQRPHQEASGRQADSHFTPFHLHLLPFHLHLPPFHFHFSSIHLLSVSILPPGKLTLKERKAQEMKIIKQYEDAKAKQVTLARSDPPHGRRNWADLRVCL